MRPFLRRNKIVLALILVLIWSPFIQYAGVNIQAIVEKRTFYFGVEAEMLNSASMTKYLKDIFSLLFLFFFFFNYIGWRRPVSLRDRNVVILLSGSAITLGSLNILSQNAIEAFACGLRWVLHLSTAIAVIYELVKMDDRTFKNFLSINSKIIVVFLLSNCFVSTLQVIYGGFGRVYGLFSSAPVMSTAVLGLSLMRFNIGGGKLGSGFTFCYVLCLFEIILSGSRIAIALMLLWPLHFIIGKMAKTLLVFLFSSLIITVIFGYFPVLVADYLADRGDSLRQNLDEGRVSIIIEKISNMFGAGLWTLLFGEGLGFGTNTFFGLFESSLNVEDRVFIADSGYLTMFVQFGFVGSTIMLGSFLLFILDIERLRVYFKASVALCYTPFLCFLIWGISQNPFEQFAFMIEISCAVAVALRMSRYNLEITPRKISGLRE